MTRDLLLATLVSAGVHALLLSVDRRDGTKPDAAVPEEPPHIIEFDLPPLEPETPEFVDSSESDAKPIEIAPPMQPDLPQAPQPDSFLQPVQPQVPTVDVPGDMKEIPAIRQPRVSTTTPIYNPDMLDQTPVARFQARPEYPFDMRKSGTSGEVVVDFIVDADGVVRNAFALRSSQREFEAAAVTAVSKWKFRPGRKAGRAVATHMQVPIVFTLNSE
ncbi:MAG: energy transducer TonB [Verrucomicrobia bacterium]|nr:energy transducer TonB [Verrucomicrobiota bacterium]